MTSVDPITCYSCEHTYRYLGRSHHSGRCPRCSSYCVAPADETKPIPVPDPVRDVLARYDGFLLSDPTAAPEQGGSIE